MGGSSFDTPSNFGNCLISRPGCVPEHPDRLSDVHSLGTAIDLEPISKEGFDVKKLLKVALIVGGIAAVAKLATARKAEWQGLTEPQVREKLDSKLPTRIPDEKRAEVADKVVAKMRERGVLAEDDEAETPEAAVPEAETDADSTPDDAGENGDVAD